MEAHFVMVIKEIGVLEYIYTYIYMDMHLDFNLLQFNTLCADVSQRIFQNNLLTCLA